MELAGEVLIEDHAVRRQTIKVRRISEVAPIGSERIEACSVQGQDNHFHCGTFIEESKFTLVT